MSEVESSAPKSALSSQSYRETDMLKFVNERNSARRPEGKKCNPKQMFGVSIDAPDNFKVGHVLKPDFNYTYKMDDSPESKRFEYYSQKHFISLGFPSSNKPTKEKIFPIDYKKSQASNQKAFHRRKGKLSQFMDKNGWMGSPYTIMGNERSQSARLLGQRDREQRVKKSQQNFAQKQKGQIKQKKTISTVSRKSFMDLLLAEKTKIRQTRNDFASACLGEEPVSIRPVTSHVTDRNKSAAQMQRQNSVKGGKEFSIKLIDWGDAQFKINHLSWNPQGSENSSKNRQSIMTPNSEICARKIPILAFSEKNNNEWMASTQGSKFSQTGRASHRTSIMSPGP